MWIQGFTFGNLFCKLFWFKLWEPYFTRRRILPNVKGVFGVLVSTHWFCSFRCDVLILTDQLRKRKRLRQKRCVGIFAKLRFHEWSLSVTQFLKKNGELFTGRHYLWLKFQVNGNLVWYTSPRVSNTPFARGPSQRVILCAQGDMRIITWAFRVSTDALWSDSANRRDMLNWIEKEGKKVEEIEISRSTTIMCCPVKRFGGTPNLHYVRRKSFHCRPSSQLQ